MGRNRYSDACHRIDRCASHGRGACRTDGDRILVYPRDPEHLADPRFVLDQHLGRLAAYLRMLGFDVWHRVPSPDEELAAVSSSEGRLLMTRDVGLLKRKEVRRGYFVRATDRQEQLAEVVRRFGLADQIHPFSRCFVCNSSLTEVEKGSVAAVVPERISGAHDRFWRCPGCGRVYWRGSHYARMMDLIASIVPPGQD